MDQDGALVERIKALKAIASSINEGAIHTQQIPEIGRVLALPDKILATTVVEREAIARQVREFEQTFDRLGYTLLDQLMPATSVSQIFQIVQAADEFKSWLKRQLGRTVKIGDESITIDGHVYQTLTRYGLSIGTPPVTVGMRDLLARIVFGKPVGELQEYVETLDCDRVGLQQFLGHMKELIDSSLHYCTAAEERQFLRDASKFANFEGATLFNRVVVTETPERVVQLLANNVFDKFGVNEPTAVKLIEGIDRIDRALLRTMQSEPNQVFIARVTGIPHQLLADDNCGEVGWRSVIGRLLMIDVSPRAQLSNTTIVYTLFPHVARTLQNVQTGVAGLPANTQLELRRMLERFPNDRFVEIRQSLERRLQALLSEGALSGSVDEVRVLEWRRQCLTDYLTLNKLKRIVSFVESIALSDDSSRKKMLTDLCETIAADWMRYFYSELSPDVYKATVVSGGGRGALTRVGEFHRQALRDHVEAFVREKLPECKLRVEEIKQKLSIPKSSSDEIEAAVRQSQLHAQAPSQWQAVDSDSGTNRSEYLARTLFWRASETASKLAKAAEDQIDLAAFANLTGPASAAFKRAMERAGLSGLHGHLEGKVGDKVDRVEKGLRELLVPFQDMLRSVNKAMDDVRAEDDPVAVGEIEAVLQVIERRAFLPILILPEMSWSYDDVFPDKHFPRANIERISFNARHEIDPKALLKRIHELRYLFRSFPEIFDLYCKSMLLVINSPHNPTGVSYRRETILKLLQIAAEYGITVVDDNSYHKLVSRRAWSAGDDCVAQIYEKNRPVLSANVRIITAGATTKGLQGAGDRTGLVHSNVPEAVDYVAKHSSDPHLMSLYMTRIKLESGLAAKNAAKVLRRVSSELADPVLQKEPWNELRNLLEQMLAKAGEDSFPIVVFETLLDGYEELLRLKQRGAMPKYLCEHICAVASRLEKLKLEVRLRVDIERRIDAVNKARERALPDYECIEPEGAFYACVRLCKGEDRGVREFLKALAKNRKVDLTYAGKGYVRMSLGGSLTGNDESYERYSTAVETYLTLLKKYWDRFEAAGRKISALDEIFKKPGADSKFAGQQEVHPAALMMEDLLPLLKAHPRNEKQAGVSVSPAERGIVFCIEEGKSVADKILVESDGCENVEELLQSRTFRVIYRRLLKRVFRNHAELSEMPFEQVDNQYGPLACLAAYRDRQLIDGVLRDIIKMLYEAWHGPNTVKILAAKLDAARHSEKLAALHGIHRKVNDLLHELIHAFEVTSTESTSTFEIGYEALQGIEANKLLPPYIARVVENCTFAGAMAPLTPAPNFVTGAVKRVSDYRYGFARRDGHSAPGQAKPPLDYFRRRFESFTSLVDMSDYVCKAEQVGPFRMLVMIHKSCMHLVNDGIRLFPQLEDVQLRENLNGIAWDGVMLFGIPARFMGDTYKTGYILDQKSDGSMLPIAWIAREDATDYVGFFKKTLLTLHNEQVKAMGGMPVHGAMITITFRNGLRKTLVFAGDSGAGKSETITAMMEQQIDSDGDAAQVKKVDILAGDMLSLWRGEDGQVYAFGTETGDFLRLTDITETWKGRFGDLLKRGSYSNLDYVKNPRVTIPGICDADKVLAPTRVNAFFYIDNYSRSGASSVVLGDSHNILRHVLVRGLRKNKGTSGDQPNLRAGLEYARENGLVTRYRHGLDELLDWQERKNGDAGGAGTYLVFRDGSGDVFMAQEMVDHVFRGRSFLLKKGDEEKQTVTNVEYDVLKNLFWLNCDSGERVALRREIYDQIFEPLVSTFCGNPFVEPEGMDRTLDLFAETFRNARVLTGSIQTQLARSGYEFTGPAKAAGDVVRFLLEDEEVNSRFQRNKDKVHQAMKRTFGGVLELGTNLPVELEGFNLLLLEEHESTHVAFLNAAGNTFTLSTPLYRYLASRGAEPRPFIPAVAMQERLEAIADICSNAEHDLDLSDFRWNIRDYDRIRYWSSKEELAYQVLLVNGVINIGSSESEVARFPCEVRKAYFVADLIAKQREPELGEWPRLKAV